MSTAGVQTSADKSVLEARDISKRFGGTVALNGVSISFRPGEVHAIVGENGAGKSTLVKILCGFYPTGTYEGSLFLDGQAITVAGIHAAEEHGIFLVPQDLQIVPELSVAENLFLNREPARFGVVDQHAMLTKAAAWLKQFEINLDPGTPMERVVPAQQQLIVIARAMMRGVKTLALDEPTAALTEAETQVLFEHLGQLRRRGIAIAYISHRLDEIVQIADHVTVLRDGVVVDRVNPGETRSGVARRIVRAMVGRDVNLDRSRRAQHGDILLSVRNMTALKNGSKRPLRNLDFDLHAGEVLGIFGSVGCGADDVVHALLGVVQCSPQTQITIRGEEVRILKPADALESGVGFLPGHRQRDGIFPLLPVAQNIGVLILNHVSQRGVVSPAREMKIVSEFYSRFKIKASSIDALISTLSGGNQQKTMLARVLSRDPDILILHDPTQGIDIATRQEVYSTIDSLARSGKAVVLVSSDLEEVFIAADRILVLKQGQAAGLWRRDEVSQDEVLAAATGAE